MSNRKCLRWRSSQQRDFGPRRYCAARVFAPTPQCALAVGANKSLKAPGLPRSSLSLCPSTREEEAQAWHEEVQVCQGQEGWDLRRSEVRLGGCRQARPHPPRDKGRGEKAVGESTGSAPAYQQGGEGKGGGGEVCSPLTLDSCSPVRP